MMEVAQLKVMKNLAARFATFSEYFSGKATTKRRSNAEYTSDWNDENKLVVVANVTILK